MFLGGLRSQTRRGRGNVEKGQVCKRWCLVFLYAELKGPVVCPLANAQQRDGNVGIEKGPVTETQESVDRRFG